MMTTHPPKTLPFRAPTLVSPLEDDLAAMGVVRDDVMDDARERYETNAAPTPQGGTPPETPKQPADGLPAWKQMFSTFGVNPDAPEDDDGDGAGRHRVRTSTGDVSPLGTYEDFIADGGWIPGETSMEVAIFRGEPESMRGHNDARFDVCFHVSGAPIDGDELMEKLRTEYGGGLFRLRFFEEKPGRTPFTSVKKSLVLSVEEDPIFKARLGKHLTHIEERRLEANRTMQREKMEYGAQQQLISMLEQQRREYAEEAKRLRDGGQGSDFQKMMLKLLEQQITDAREAARQAREEGKMTESHWLNIFNESARERDEAQQRLMQTTLTSQEKMFDVMSKSDEKMSPIIAMMMQQQQADAAARREERIREEERRREERERERAAALQQQQMFQLMMQQQQEQANRQMQLMLAMMGTDKKEDSFSKIASVLAGSPVVAKLLDRPQNQGNEMMQILLPLMTNDKQNAEKRAAMLEDRMMQVLQAKNDPKQSMMELMQMMQLMRGMQTVMAPPVPVVEEKDEEEDSAATAVPAWLGAASDVAEKFGLGRVAEAFATSLINRGGTAAPTPPAVAQPAEQPRAPRASPLVATGTPPMPPMPHPMAQLPAAQPPPMASPMPTHAPMPHFPSTPQHALPSTMEPQQNYTGSGDPFGQSGFQVQPHHLQVIESEPSQPLQKPKKTGPSRQEEQEMFDQPPPPQAIEIFDEIERALSQSPAMSPADFASSRPAAEKMVLRAILPRHIAVNYIRHHAQDKPNIQSMEGLKWLQEVVQHIYG